MVQENLGGLKPKDVATTESVCERMHPLGHGFEVSQIKATTERGFKTGSTGRVLSVVIIACHARIEQPCYFRRAVAQREAE